MRCYVRGGGGEGVACEGVDGGSGGEGDESCEDMGTLRMEVTLMDRTLRWEGGLTTRPVQPTRATGEEFPAMVGWLGVAWAMCGQG